MIQVMLGGIFILSLNTLGTEWKTGNGVRSTALAVPNTGKTGFTLVPVASSGIEFTNFLSRQRGQTNMVLWNGSGVAAGDVNQDGLCDLYFCNLEGENSLFLNLGDWHFKNITAAAGVGCRGQNSVGAVFADVDGNGTLDLLVSSIGSGVRLFINDGMGHFQESTAAAGLTSTTGSMTMTLADINNDGSLDLYVANYRKDTFQDQPNMKFLVAVENGKRVITHVNGQLASLPNMANRYVLDENGVVLESGEPDVLYSNNGHGVFSPVDWTGGSFLDEQGKPLQEVPYDWGLSAMFRDINGDGAPDLYVCNDTHSADRIWINQGNGKFRALPSLALRQTSYSSMGVDFADLNRDGFDEIFVTDMLSREHTNRQTQFSMRRSVAIQRSIERRPDYQRNTLFLNRGDGSYAEISQYSGIDATDWTWSPVFLDVDLDGYEDLLITTGHAWNLLHIDTRILINTIRRRENLSNAEFYKLRALYKPFDCPNYAFRNLGNLSFTDASSDWGFDSRQISQGMCLADLDNDGDLDVVVNCFNQPALVYKNESIAPRIAVRLKGRSGNKFGIGALIKVTGGPVPQSQQMLCGGRYVSCDDAIRVFAAGSITNRLSIEVRWRCGALTTVTNALPNHTYEVCESEAIHYTNKTTVPINPFFRDVSDTLSHIHQEDLFDDFSRQPSLTKSLSQSGPGVSWFDLDRDGLEDLLIGCSRGGKPGLFRNLGRGNFEPFSFPLFSKPALDDESMILGYASLGTNKILVARTNYKSGGLSEVNEFITTPQEAYRSIKLAVSASSIGPLSMADVDGDGDLDLFVGNRVAPGRYPIAISSFLYKAQSNSFVLDEKNSKVLKDIGLVNSAVFTDLNEDGFPDLVLACEWGPLYVFINKEGTLTPWDIPIRLKNSNLKEHQPAQRLSGFRGWWQSVTTGDFDADGRMDIIAANWGSNGRYKSYVNNSIRIYYQDDLEDKTIKYLETYYDHGIKKWVPWQRWDKVLALFPFAQERIHSFEQFSISGINEILQDNFSKMMQLSVNIVESIILLNRGTDFEPVPLPMEAQIAPCFGVCVGDLDGNGTEDLFLNQNFFAVDSDTSRYDGGRGLLLQGDGHGGFSPVPGQLSGIKIYGQGRGAALCDYDSDGRIDLVAAQNDAVTKLYHNEKAKPGLRVRLKGSPENSQAIGAKLRLGDGKILGPAREMRIGAGWLSQDSSVHVLSMPSKTTQIHITWPGGRKTVSAIPDGVFEISVDSTGSLKVLK